MKTVGESRGIGLAPQNARPNLARFGRAWCDGYPLTLQSEEYLARADSILQGRFSIFALHDVPLGFPPRWNCDPKTGAVAPLRFGKGIDYRNEQQVGDIKYLWEINRHLVLTSLSQAYLLSQDDKYSGGAAKLLESWFRQCPYPNGINWTSALEAAIRLINWAVSWHMLGGHESKIFQGDGGQRFLHQWLECIHQHCHFIAGYLSLHSSANNHLFGELTGLFVASVTWPCWDSSSSWSNESLQGLEREAERQIGRDGVHLEQAFYYQHEVLDMMLLCHVFGSANGRAPSAGFISQIERSMEFLSAVMDVEGNVPMIGDSDDALMVDWDPSNQKNIYRSLLATGAVLFAREDFKERAVGVDDKTLWLLGEKASKRFSEIPAAAASPPLAQAFEAGGYYILGSNLGSRNEIRVVADAGPVGYLSISAHGHADALSFTMSVAGRELLIDPGTYAYHTERRWRDYFRGTSAHNTAVVDSLDQSVSGGNFLWLRKARVEVHRWHSTEAEDYLQASHDGYARLDDPVMHRRALRFKKDRSTLFVEDEFVCAGEHDVVVRWHFAETSTVEVKDDEVWIFNDGAIVRLSMDGAATRRVLRGSETPLAGWVSRAYDEKRESWTLEFSGRIFGATTWRTKMVMVTPA